MNSFFTLHSFLKVGKTQDLSSKFWQNFGDAVSSGDVRTLAGQIVLWSR
jgi:hypothetical protein